VEEHGPGGLGAAVAETLAIRGRAVPFLPLRLAKSPIKVSGSQEQLRAAQGLSIEGIVQASEMLCRNPRPAVIR
jgi:transketolase C-terminal domain/subunit